MAKKQSGGLMSPMHPCYPAPSKDGGTGIFDHNTAESASNPAQRGPGDLPMKFYEDIHPTPAPTVSSFKSGIAKRPKK